MCAYETAVVKWRYAVITTGKNVYGRSFHIFHFIDIDHSIADIA